MFRVRRQIGCLEGAASRYTGKNVAVAILDTGIARHPDLNGRILDSGILHRDGRKCMMTVDTVLM